MNPEQDKISDAPRVKGKIHAYSIAVNAGTIAGEDKKIYLFSRKDWLSPQEPTLDMSVFFTAERNWAKSITVAEP